MQIKSDTWRIREYRIGLRSLMMFLQNGKRLGDCIEVVQHDLPEGARIHHIAPHYGGMFISVFVEHESFDVVPDGGTAPEACLQFHANAYPVLKAGQWDYVLDDMEQDELMKLTMAAERNLCRNDPLLDPSSEVNFDAYAADKAVIVEGMRQAAEKGKEMLRRWSKDIEDKTLSADTPIEVQR